MDNFKAASKSHEGTNREMPKAAAVLSFSTAKSSTASNDEPPLKEFTMMDVRTVRRFLRKFPQGQLWSIDSAGRVSAVEDAPLALDSDSSTESDLGAHRENHSLWQEAECLTACFPGVRQVLYAPIHDPATSKAICACFAISLHETPVFTTEIEVAFTRGFLNNVAVEWDRVAISIANRKKEDFLSSISHVSF